MFNLDNVKGNAFIYFIFQVCNIALSILGLATIGISAYLIGATKSFNMFSLSFLCFGVALIVLSYFGCYLRYSPFGNLVYMLVLSVIFLCDFMVTIMIFFFKEEIIEKVLHYYNQDDMSIDEATKLVNQNITTVNYFLLIIVILFVSFLFAFFYLL